VLTAALLTVLPAASVSAAESAPAPPASEQRDPGRPAGDAPARRDAPARGGAGRISVDDVPAVPDVAISVDGDDGALSRTVVIVLLLTVGSVAPGLLLLMTAFTRFVVVLGLAKNALGLQTIPPSQVLVGLALFLTFFVMSPVLSEVNADAVQPLLVGSISQEQALERGFSPIRQFMLAQTREEDLRLFLDLADGPRPATRAEVPAATLIPAFAISELRSAFIIGFIIFIPFLVIDLVVSAVLMSMGMMMLPPVFVSLPLKLLLFVLVDGWVLIVGSLVNSVHKVVV
jgi:flagellar biosynthetic protein FliP